MAFQLSEVVPWGRSFEEYVSMFSLTGDDLRLRILGCGDGPAAFNDTLTKRGGSVVSVDPLYRFSAEQIAARIEETFDVVMELTRRNSGEFVWGEIPCVEALGETRMKAMSAFLSDFTSGKIEGRYLDAELPQLPFDEKCFDLALCSHFLLLYSAQFDLQFHLQSLRELCRIAHEVRVFPLLELGSLRSRHLDEVVSTLAAEGFQVDIEPVRYEFQKGGNEMLRLRERSKTGGGRGEQRDGVAR
jgi:hypothetical protein